MVWFPQSCDTCTCYSENDTLTCEEPPKELVIFCWLGRIPKFICMWDVPSFSNSQVLGSYDPEGSAMQLLIIGNNGIFSMGITCNCQ